MCLGCVAALANFGALLLQLRLKFADAPLRILEQLGHIVGGSAPLINLSVKRFQALGANGKHFFASFVHWVSFPFNPFAAPDSPALSAIPAPQCTLLHIRRRSAGITSIAFVLAASNNAAGRMFEIGRA